MLINIIYRFSIQQSIVGCSSVPRLSRYDFVHEIIKYMGSIFTMSISIIHFSLGKSNMLKWGSHTRTNLVILIELYCGQNKTVIGKSQEYYIILFNTVFLFSVTVVYWFSTFISIYFFGNSKILFFISSLKLFAIMVVRAIK